MTLKRRRLQQLLAVSHALGDPRCDYVRLGEGNVSAAIDRRSFWIKASGVPLHRLRPSQCVEVAFSEMLDALHGAARRRRTPPPSIEALFHAILLQLPGVTFVGHTHPTAVNRVLCSRRSRELVRARIFPDEIVYCGTAPVYVPYRDPGIPLAMAIQRGVAAHRNRTRDIPRLILLENHGLIALGATPQEVIHVTTMAVKAAQILWGASVIGRPRYLTAARVAAVARRPDEQYRRDLLRGRG